MICTIKELNELDLGVHMQVMEEWNEETDFKWQDEAEVVLHGYYTRVIHQDGIGGLYIMTYLTHGEGDIQSLRLYSDTPSHVALNPAPSSARWVQNSMKEIHITGLEMWWHKDKAA